MFTLLVVEDDETIGSALHSSLRAHGYRVQWERSGHDALRTADRGAFALVLLDLGLPDLDGVEVCRRIRASQPSTVLIMLTARTDEMDVVVGLEAGADDYLTKPVRLTELLARIRAHLRRGRPVAAQSTLVVGDLTVSMAERRALVGGQEITLRTKEFDLLARLAAQPGHAISRETLMADVWDERWLGSTKTLDVHVASLRRRLAESPGVPPQIVTLRGFGYRLE